MMNNKFGSFNVSISLSSIMRDCLIYGRDFIELLKHTALSESLFGEIKTHCMKQSHSKNPVGSSESSIDRLLFFNRIAYHTMCERVYIFGSFFVVI